MNCGKSVAILIAVLTFAGCGAPGAPQPPSLQLPRPVEDLRAERKGDEVFLTWSVPTETTDGQLVRRLGATRICRSMQVAMVRCTEVAGEVPTAKIAAAQTKPPPSGQSSKKKSPNKEAQNKEPAIQASFVEQVPANLQAQAPTGFINYAVETLNTNGRSAGLSNQVQAPLAPVLPAPKNVAARVTPDGILVSWEKITPPVEIPGLAYKYRVHRRAEGSASGTVIGEVPVSSGNPASITDNTFEWEKTYWYRVSTATVLSQPQKSSLDIDGNESGEVKIFAHDVFPPAAPSGVQAVFSGIGQKLFVDVTWAPGTDADLAGYNIYRRQGNGGKVKLNPELIKTPTFRDEDIARGKRYFYSVSAVDLRGNESASSEEASEDVPRE